MIPERIEPLTTPDGVCQLSQRWRISDELAQRLVVMSGKVPFSMEIISGFRMAEEQDRLRESGRPTADNDRSTHLSCPATGADLRIIGVFPDDPLKAAFGLGATEAGLRWGGGSKPDPETGIPSDWNHVDLGPRNTP